MSNLDELSNRPNCEGCNRLGYINEYFGNRLCPAIKEREKLTNFKIE